MNDEGSYIIYAYVAFAPSTLVGIPVDIKFERLALKQPKSVNLMSDTNISRYKADN